MTDSKQIAEQLAATAVVPVVVIDDAKHAVPLAQALVDGGLPVIEITLRTAAAIDAIKAISAEVPGAVVGAGTVLSAQHAKNAVAAGSDFLVSPGLYEPVIDAAAELGVPIYPGISTASEAQRAWNLGLRVLKFFPAGLAGGVPMLKALSSVFGDLSFMPTGGVSAKNLGDYLALPAVVACGGSWLSPADALESGDFDRIRSLAKEARDIAREIRRD